MCKAMNEESLMCWAGNFEEASMSLGLQSDNYNFNIEKRKVMSNKL